MWRKFTDMGFKIAGVIFLCIGGAMLGAVKALSLSERVCLLSGLYEAIGVFENEIEFKTAPVYDAFKSAAARDKSGVFAKARENIFEKGVCEAFEEAVLSKKMPPQEREVLLSFAKGLSADDKDGQSKNAALAAKRIDEILKSATLRREKLFSLYCSMGILGGITGAIVLL